MLKFKYVDNLIERVGLRKGYKLVDLTTKRVTAEMLFEAAVKCTSAEKVCLKFKIQSERKVWYLTLPITAFSGRTRTSITCSRVRVGACRAKRAVARSRRAARWSSVAASPPRAV